ncbi:hypothetical protein [Delftia sp. PS-11]|uniref:hypothetical protein n=1 Tax=Delftia sp. PS-11 TaxID=2767222 RepID=UPI0024542C2F|nr:hypothetical protein [Delftia sp. PS-11]KAJ8745724.1 hypothetical protein H9T68_05725 [Delftia sp. PS-11]
MSDADVMIAGMNTQIQEHPSNTFGGVAPSLHQTNSHGDEHSDAIAALPDCALG